jgi:hypothetical protein
MSTPASTITYLQLDASGDPIMNPAASLRDAAAVRQAILTRLLLFQGEWWEDLNEGTPYFQKILGVRATPNNQQIMAQVLAARITGTPYVSAVQNVAVAFDPRTRKFSFSAKVQTTFGLVDVSFEPGALAGSSG